MLELLDELHVGLLLPLFPQELAKGHGVSVDEIRPWLAVNRLVRFLNVFLDFYLDREGRDWAIFSQQTKHQSPPVLANLAREIGLLPSDCWNDFTNRIDWWLKLRIPKCISILVDGNYKSRKKMLTTKQFLERYITSDVVTGFAFAHRLTPRDLNVITLVD